MSVSESGDILVQFPEKPTTNIYFYIFTIQVEFKSTKSRLRLSLLVYKDINRD